MYANERILISEDLFLFLLQFLKDSILLQGVTEVRVSGHVSLVGRGTHSQCARQQSQPAEKAAVVRGR